MDDFLDIAVLWLISFVGLEVIGGWVGIIVAIITGIAIIIRTIQSFKKRKEERKEHIQKTEEHAQKMKEHIQKEKEHDQKIKEHIQKEKEHIQRTEKNELEIQLLRKQLEEKEKENSKH